MKTLLNQYFTSVSVLKHKRVQAKMAFVWAIVEIVLGLFLAAAGIGLYLLFEVKHEKLANGCLIFSLTFAFLLLLMGIVGAWYETNAD